MIKFKLKEIMEIKGMKISELNEITGISRNSLSLLINGKSQGIQFDTLEKIANALKINVSELFEQTFNFFSVKIDKKMMLSTEKLKNLKVYNHPKDEIDSERFQKDNEYVLQCVITTDNKIWSYYLPYRIVVAFNPTPILRIEIEIENYDSENQFSYIFNNFDYAYILFNYLVTNKIIEFEKELIDNISNKFGLHLDTIIMHNDFPILSDSQLISLTKNRKVNKQRINFVLDDANKNKLYNFSLTDDEYIIKSLR